MHLKQVEDGYEVTAFDEVEDGSDWEPSAKKLFGKHYDAFMKLYSDDKDSEKQRLQVVSEYVKRNNLPITQYQDYGWDPVGL